MPPDNMAPDIWFPNLNIYFDNVPRHIVSIAGFDIYWYAVWIVLGIASAYFLAAFHAKRTGQNVQNYTDLLMLGVPMAFVGLRTYYLVFNWGRYAGQPVLRTIFNIRGGGLAIYGGIIGALLAGIIMARVKKVPFTTFTDTCAPSLLLGQIVGRMGNFFNREAFGGYTEGRFAMRMRLDQVRGPLTEEILNHRIVIQSVEYVQVHPTFLYEAFFNLLLMIALILYRPHKRFNGEIILLYLFGYGVIRFFVEGLRTDQLMFFDTGLPVSQLVSVIFAGGAMVAIVIGHVWGSNRKGRS